MMAPGKMVHAAGSRPQDGLQRSGTDCTASNRDHIAADGLYKNGLVAADGMELYVGLSADFDRLGPLPAGCSSRPPGQSRN
jgi:hypothetical protein